MCAVDGKRLKSFSRNGEYFRRSIDIDSLSNATCLVINQKSIGDVGVVVWDCAIMLSKYFDHQNKLSPGLYKGLQGVELGSGTGVCGLVLSLLG